MIPIIVQARMSSKRLPGKVLMPWGETTLLGHILTELLKVGQPVYVATSTDPSDDVLVDHVLTFPDVNVYRGELDDVLGRFLGCIETMAIEPETIVRICADRPFVSASLVEALIEEWWAHDHDGYLSAGHDGSLVELVPVMDLKDADKFNGDREHICEFVKQYKTSVDTEADYQRLCPSF